jgi:hypothetical protein
MEQGCFHLIIYWGESVVYILPPSPLLLPLVPLAPLLEPPLQPSQPPLPLPLLPPSPDPLRELLIPKREPFSYSLYRKSGSLASCYTRSVVTFVRTCAGKGVMVVK